MGGCIDVPWAVGCVHRLRHLKNECGLQPHFLERPSNRFSIGNPVGHSVEISHIDSNAVPDLTAIASAVNPARDDNAGDALAVKVSSHHYAVLDTQR